MSTVPSVKKPGQKFLTTQGYRAVNSGVVEHARRAVEESLGACTADDVYKYVLNHRQEIEGAYRAVGLSGPEIRKTWRNLLYRTKKDAGRIGTGEESGIQMCVDHAYVAPRDRRFRLMA